MRQKAWGQNTRENRPGAFDYGVISFSGNKIITGSSGGALLTNDSYSAFKARKWSMQGCEDAPWNQQEELGYNYRMSNVIAGVVLGQWKYLERHIAEKKRIYDKYVEELEPLGVEMNPYVAEESDPNYWLSCMKIDPNSLCEMTISEWSYTYKNVHGRTCPMEILEALEAFFSEGRQIWKPLHLQPMYRNYEFISVDSKRQMGGGFFSQILEYSDESMDLFRHGICLPSDIKMTEEEQEQVIEIIYACYSERRFDRIAG